SSAAICRLMVDWSTARSSAAREILPASATAANNARSSEFIRSLPRCRISALCVRGWPNRKRSTGQPARIEVLLQGAPIIAAVHQYVLSGHISGVHTAEKRAHGAE